MKNIGQAMKLNIVLLSALAIFAVSCEKDDSPMTAEAFDEEMTIAQVLESYADTDETGDLKSKRGSKPTFATLSVALARTGLAGTVASNRLTIFAPTDAAFAELGLYPRNIASVPNLKEILLYHAVGSVVYSYQLSNGFVPTLNGAAVEINLDNGVMVNDAKVIKADIKARNGVIHAIDKVMFPPDKNLVELALSYNPEFSILVKAVIAAGLDGVLATGGPFTVFAPTNDAFGKLGITMDNVADVEDLDKILLYHVVPGRVFSSDLVSGPVATLNGTFNINVGTLTITDARDREAGLIASLLNIQATNGVVHVIDTVILP